MNEDIHIQTASLSVPLINVNLTIGKEYSDGYIKLKMTTTTSGTMTMKDGVILDIKILNGELTGITPNREIFKYKLLTNDTNTITLIQTDVVLRDTMNSNCIHSPQKILSLTSNTETAELIPTNGQMSIYNYNNINNYGDSNSSAIKSLIDFTNKTIKYYDLNNNLISENTFTLSSDKKSIIIEYEKNLSYMSMQILNNINGIMVFKTEEHYEYSMGKGSAYNATDIKTWLTHNNNYLWKDEYENISMKVIFKSDNTIIDYIEKNDNGNIQKINALISNDKKSLLISYEHGTEQYFINVSNNSIDKVEKSLQYTLHSTKQLINYTFTDIFYTSSTSEILNGTTEIDTLSYQYATTGVNINLATKTAQATVGSGSDTITNFENLYGSNYNDSLIGDGLTNLLYGLLGNDILNGGIGADIMSGGLGNDTYYMDNIGDKITENSNEGIDKVFSTLSYALGLNLENLELTGTSAINATGNTLNNTIIGNSGNNIINGLTGADIMSGGLGNDTYYMDNIGDKITENTNAGIDKVFSTLSYALGLNLENLELTGTSAINATGNTLNNTIIGNSGNNIINGLTGADIMSGGLGNDTYYMDNIGDKITENTNAGIDKVFSTLSYALGLNLENLELTGTSAINATGNTLNNTIIGNSGNNIINGLAGADIMSGGTGKDTFVFNTTLNSTTNKDTISDFRAIDDVIHLENAIFAKLTTNGVLNSSMFKASANGLASDSNDYILYNKSNGNLSYDSDGNGSASAVLFATLTNRPTDLTYADFLII